MEDGVEYEFYYSSESDFDPDSFNSLIIETENNNNSTDFKYTIYSSDQLYQQLMLVVQRCSDLMKLPKVCVRILLNQISWKEEKLVDIFFSEAVNELLLSAKLKYLLEMPFDQPSIKFICQICFREDETKTALSNACNHYFCPECWICYIQERLEIGIGDAAAIQCPMYNCEVMVDDDFIFLFIKGLPASKLYKGMICKSYAKSSKCLRTCPAFSCNNSIKTESFKARKVVCDCGEDFCFKCGGKPHEPVDCELFRLWTDKYAEFCKTSDWLKLNSKECPKCRAIIIKEGGCNQIRCIVNGCNYCFCWVCMKPWDKHVSNDMYQCNQYTISKSNIDADENRWNFFYKRYLNHENSISIIKQYLEKIKNYFSDIKQKALTAKEVNIIQKFIDQLIYTRYTLMFSYIFACATIENNHFEIFLSNQRNLEVIVENVSNFMENLIFSNNFSFEEICEYLFEKDMLCEQRRQVLSSIVYEGYDKKYWQFEQQWKPSLPT